jgi:hypothetical protein
VPEVSGACAGEWVESLPCCSWLLLSYFSVEIAGEVKNKNK